jgi:basic membrane protein A
VGVAALAAAIAVAALGSAKAPAAQKAGYKVALVSDVAGFNDNGFNKNQLKGLNRAKSKLGVTAFPIVSHSSSDYQPNYNQAVHDGAQLIIAAGFLLGDTMKQYATQEGGCLVGVLAAKMAQKMGHKVIGVAGGLKIPPVDSYIAGYKYCAAKAVKGTKTVVQYSGDFEDQTKCSAIAQNEIQGQKAQVIFQVAGLCGDGALKEASKLHKWGIGVDADEFSVASRILTSALKKTDVGVYDTIAGAAKGKFKGGQDLLFNLKNNGVGVGKISPKVPKSWIKLMNSYKAQIIKGKLKPPACLKGKGCPKGA